jgi:hypothetical protein
MTRTVRFIAVASAALVMLLAATGCGRDKAASEPVGTAASGAANDPAAAAAKAPAGLQSAKAFVVSSQKELAAIVREVEAAAGDKPRLEALGKRYRDWVAATDKRARELDGAMSAAERKTLEASAEEAWGPLVDRLVKALQHAAVAPEARPVRGPGSEQSGDDAP